MTRVQFTLETDVPSERVLAAAVEFSERRLQLWPNISRRFYTVHEVGETSADVTEGSDTMGGIWARERYEWSTPGTVRATVQDSNVFQAGGTWEIRVHPTQSGGSHIELTRNRRGKGIKGRIIETLLAIAGRKVLSTGLQQTLDILARSRGEPEVVMPMRRQGKVG
jgi:polyketide cyclase/dehydrase/lipid transport protein